MGGRRLRRSVAAAAMLLAGTAGAADAASAGGDDGGGPAAHWTAARRAAAQPRDLVLDHRGLAYRRGADGELTPHGHTVRAEPAPLRQVPAARPGGGGGGGGGGAGGGSDATGPTVTVLDPVAGATIGGTHTFRARVVDTSGVRSVTFVLQPSGGPSQSFSASPAGGDEWTTTLTGFTDGTWSWHVVARDNARKGGNATTTTPTSFTVSTGTGGGGGSTVTNAPWTSGGAVQRAAGRIYFEMDGVGYVCSGTAVTDTRSDRSVILTAAHCVYDDESKAFATNVLFIPDQGQTSGSGTDRDCSNDPYGCWAPSFGVVDQDWTTRVFPDNIPWDYGYYVVDGTSHTGTGTYGHLDDAVGTLAQQLTAAPTVGQQAHALGYSYSDDPDLMYCAEPLGTYGADNWWLDSCGLSGGASGGPWVQPLSAGSGPVVSVNSWGFRNQPGMAGPKLAGTSASCLFTAAQGASLATSAGVAPTGC